MAEANSYWWILFAVFLIPYIVNASATHYDHSELHRTKRQFSIDDLIQSALSLVRPIIDTTRPIVQPVDETTINKKMPERDRVILGETRYSSLDDVPICKGNSRICKFISCTAHNFKNDESFSNLNLAAQVLSDTKLRKAISKDPDALSTVCHEQSLSGSQCKLFQKGFQLIDKFITSIEPAESMPMKTTQRVQEDFYRDEQDAPPVPIRPTFESDSGPVYDDPQPAMKGSRTWSSHPEPVMDLNDPPSPAPAVMTLPTFPPLLFTFPTFPTVPPIFPVIPTSNKSPLSLFNLDNQLFKQHGILDSNLAKIFQPKLSRMMRSVNSGAIESDDLDFDESDERVIRRKRESDYYDELEEQTTQKTKVDGSHETDGSVSDENQRRPLQGAKKGKPDGHIDCLLLLQ